MKSWYRKLNLSYQTSVWSAVVIVIALLFTIPLMRVGRFEYTIGLLAGGILAVLFNFLLGLCEKLDSHKADNVWTAIIIFGRYLVVIGLGFLFGFMYYRWSIKVIEPITFACAYFSSLIVYLVLSFNASRKESHKLEVSEVKDD
ncbi:MAG: hypothetical protein LUD22_00870 [Coprobacillus sp.]|nr:hypothetical protein [Coprobacillus sp.]